MPQAMRDELVAGHRWRATFTATALTACELYMLRVEDFHRWGAGRAEGAGQRRCHLVGGGTAARPLTASSSQARGAPVLPLRASHRSCQCRCLPSAGC